MTTAAAPYKRYNGGKAGSGVYHTIINNIPACKCFVSAFTGNGGIERHLKLPKQTIFNDIDPAVYSGWKPLMKQGRYAKADIALFNLDYKDLVEMLGLTNPETPHIKETLIYMDVPYLIDTRKSQRDLYAYEFSYDDHVEFLNLVPSLECMVLINHPPHILYENRLPSVRWRITNYKSMTAGGTMMNDRLWFNYPPPDELQDCRYVGTDYRDREQIKKKVNSLVRKYEALTPHLKQVFHEKIK